MKRIFVFLNVWTLLFLSVAWAQEYTSLADIAKDTALKRDFDLQGEYLGKFGDYKVGLNVIALGDGKFDFVAFVGGLPGDGWVRGDIRAFGKLAFQSDDELEFQLEQVDEGYSRRNITADDIDMLKGSATFKDGKLTFVGSAAKFEFARENRESPTLGLKAPEGALVFFADGKKSDMLEGKVNEEAKTLWAEAWTKPFEKKPYTMHVEFMLSYMPQARGQGRSNSGVYIDEAYECQVLDSFGLEGENNECGGFYTVAKPFVNMCYPPLRWQTYDIEFTPAKYDADGKKTDKAIITVKHNGKLIHKEIRPEKETPGRKAETPEARGVYFQGHGNKVQYGNIWIKYAD